VCGINAHKCTSVYTNEPNIAPTTATHPCTYIYKCIHIIPHTYTHTHIPKFLEDPFALASVCVFVVSEEGEGVDLTSESPLSPSGMGLAAFLAFLLCKHEYKYTYTYTAPTHKVSLSHTHTRKPTQATRLSRVATIDWRAINFSWAVSSGVIQFSWMKRP
jgi:hypothetical protein